MHPVEDVPRWLKKSRRVGGRSELAIYRGDKRFQQPISRGASFYLIEISEIPQNTFT
jgi:hypothetical protein